VVRDVVSAQERARIRLLLEQGRSYRQIMALVGRSSGTITSVVKSCGGPAPPGDWLPAPGRLSLADREEISVALAAGQTLTAIAVRLGRALFDAMNSHYLASSLVGPNRHSPRPAGHIPWGNP